MTQHCNNLVNIQYAAVAEFVWSGIFICQIFGQIDKCIRKPSVSLQIFMAIVP